MAVNEAAQSGLTLQLATTPSGFKGVMFNPRSNIFLVRHRQQVIGTALTAEEGALMYARSVHRVATMTVNEHRRKPVQPVRAKLGVAAGPVDGNLAVTLQLSVASGAGARAPPAPRSSIAKRVHVSAQLTALGGGAVRLELNLAFLQVPRS